MIPFIVGTLQQQGGGLNDKDFSSLTHPADVDDALIALAAGAETGPGTITYPMRSADSTAAATTLAGRGFTLAPVDANVWVKQTVVTTSTSNYNWRVGNPSGVPLHYIRTDGSRVSPTTAVDTAFDGGSLDLTAALGAPTMYVVSESGPTTGSPVDIYTQQPATVFWTSAQPPVESNNFTGVGADLKSVFPNLEWWNTGAAKTTVDLSRIPDNTVGMMWQNTNGVDTTITGALPASLRHFRTSGNATDLIGSYNTDFPAELKTLIVEGNANRITGTGADLAKYTQLEHFKVTARNSDIDFTGSTWNGSFTSPNLWHLQLDGTNADGQEMTDPIENWTTATNLQILRVSGSNIGVVGNLETWALTQSDLKQLTIRTDSGATPLTGDVATIMNHMNATANPRGFDQIVYLYDSTPTTGTAANQVSGSLDNLNHSLNQWQTVRFDGFGNNVSGNLATAGWPTTRIHLLGYGTDVSGDLATMTDAWPRYIRVQGVNTLTGDLGAVGTQAAVDEFIVDGFNTISGNADLRTTLTGVLTFRVLGNNTMSGLPVANSTNNSYTLWGNNTTSGDIAAVWAGGTNFGSSTYSVHGNTTISGDVTQSPTGMTTLYVAGSNTLSGDITGVAVSQFANDFWLLGNNTLTGDVSSITGTDNNVDSFVVGGNNTLSGDITTGLGWAPNIEYFDIQGNNTLSGDFVQVITDRTQLQHIGVGGSNTMTADFTGHDFDFGLVTIELSGQSTSTGLVDVAGHSVLGVKFVSPNTTVSFNTADGSQLRGHFETNSPNVDTATVDGLLNDATAATALANPNYDIGGMPEPVVGAVADTDPVHLLRDGVFKTDYAGVGARTAASDAAVTAMTGNGWTITTN